SGHRRPVRWQRLVGAARSDGRGRRRHRAGAARGRRRILAAQSRKGPTDGRRGTPVGRGVLVLGCRGGPSGRHPRGPYRRHRRPELKSRRAEVVRWTLAVVTVVAAGFYLVPKAGEALRAARGLSGVKPGWIGLALAAELASLLAFSAVTYLLVEPDRRPVFRRVVRADLVSIGLSHAVPAGSAAGTVLGYKLLADEGAGSLQAGFAKVTQSLISVVVLQRLLWGALAMVVIFGRPTAPYVVLAGIGAAAVIGILALAWLLVRREPVVERMAVKAFSI